MNLNYGTGESLLNIDDYTETEEKKEVKKDEEK